MTAMVYVIGGAACGKSTFTGSLLELVGAQLGALEDLYSAPNSAGATITLRGQRFPQLGGGVYLGLLRDSHPGTDALDRVSSVAARPWLDNGPLPRAIIGEGATLAVRPFLLPAASVTDLLVVHLWDEEWITELRCAQRGTTQDEKFVRATASRSANLARELARTPAKVVGVQTSDSEAWKEALSTAAAHLR